MLLRFLVFIKYNPIEFMGIPNIIRTGTITLYVTTDIILL